MKKQFRFVIIGSGNISRTYFQATGNLEDTKIVGLVSRSGRKPEFVPAEIEVARTLADIQGGYEAVILATPNGLHLDGALEAARLGKHVLTEKPLEITISRMDSMLAACRSAGLKLGVAFQHRMSPDNRIIKKMIDTGEFGRIYSADYVVRCWRDQSYYDSAEWRGGWEIDGGGPFIQQAAHEIDLYSWFFGRPAEVCAFTDTYAHTIEVEDHGAALFRHDNGMIGTFVASTVGYPGFEPTLTIQTQKGTVIMRNGRITGWHIESIDNPSQEPAGTLHSGAASAAVTDTSGHEAIIKDFIDAIKEDRQPIVSGDSARPGTELTLRIYGKAD